jgi:hypothetical protein
LERVVEGAQTMADWVCLVVEDYIGDPRAFTREPTTAAERARSGFRRDRDSGAASSVRVYA